ncbi:MAG: glycosyltransferase family 4 protein [Oscillospiraceae bacterium]|jgi:1,2-diacylglycerol-3-alpha-glucose alpha-1,2-galactosyltransferase|nr:glycosyltransferase family 4 protein [Oscillospiraceae bacterium]
MEPIINMMSSATKVKGQGVGSAYIEQVNLVKEKLGGKFKILENARVKADITHYHTIDPKFSLTRKSRTKRGKSLGYVHMLPETVDQSLSLPKFARKIFYKYMIAFYKSMDYLVTVNPYFIGELERYGVLREKVSYIPNYVSSDAFYPLPKEKKKVLRGEYDIPEDKFVVLSAGQLQTRKGVFTFLEMAERLPEVQFVWAGGFSFGRISDGYAKIKKVTENPPPNVKFLGIIDRELMNGVYNLADIMLLASFEELFPMTVLEAMCTNTPILLRDLEIYEDILFDFYFKEKDTAGFVEAVRRLANDRDYYGQGVEMAKKGNAFYSKESVADMWEELYVKIYKNEKID